jgi:hypothetical protein
MKARNGKGGGTGFAAAIALDMLPTPPFSPACPLTRRYPHCSSSAFGSSRGASQLLSRAVDGSARSANDTSSANKNLPHVLPQYLYALDLVSIASFEVSEI